jgi:hypothetical protein
MVPNGGTSSRQSAGVQRRRPNSRNPVRPSRWSGHAHTRASRSSACLQVVVAQHLPASAGAWASLGLRKTRSDSRKDLCRHAAFPIPAESLTPRFHCSPPGSAAPGSDVNAPVNPTRQNMPKPAGTHANPGLASAQLMSTNGTRRQRAKRRPVGLAVKRFVGSSPIASTHSKRTIGIWWGLPAHRTTMDPSTRQLGLPA